MKTARGEPVSVLDRFRPLTPDMAYRIKQEIIDNCDLVGDCWVYRSASPNGYGMKYIQGKMRTASCLHAARCSPSISRRMPATSGSALTRLAATLGICSGAATQRTASRGSRRSARSSAGPLRFRR